MPPIPPFRGTISTTIEHWLLAMPPNVFLLDALKGPKKSGAVLAEWHDRNFRGHLGIHGCHAICSAWLIARLPSTGSYCASWCQLVRILWIRAILSHSLLLAS